MFLGALQTLNSMPDMQACSQKLCKHSIVCLMAGMFSGAVQTLISTPVDLLKIRQQLQTTNPGMASHVGPLQLLCRIMVTEGLPGAEEHQTSSVRDASSATRATALRHAGSSVASAGALM